MTPFAAKIPIAKVLDKSTQRIGVGSSAKLLGCMAIGATRSATSQTLQIPKRKEAARRFPKLTAHPSLDGSGTSSRGSSALMYRMPAIQLDLPLRSWNRETPNGDQYRPTYPLRQDAVGRTVPGEWVDAISGDTHGIGLLADP